MNLQKMKEDHLNKIKKKYGNTITGIAVSISLEEIWDDLIKIYNMPSVEELTGVKKQTNQDSTS